MQSDTGTNRVTESPVRSSRWKQRVCCVDECSPLDLVGGGEVSPKTSLDLWETRCFPPPAQSHKPLSGFAEFFSASYSPGLRRDSEPEDAPTGHSDSDCLVFLLFPRRLYQVRRTNILPCSFWFFMRVASSAASYMNFSIISHICNYSTDFSF